MVRSKKILLYFISPIFSIMLSIVSLELLVRLVVDNGFNYELEMMKYAKIKTINEINDHKIFLHKPNVDQIIMRANIKTDVNGYRYNKLNTKVRSALSNKTRSVDCVILDTVTVNAVAIGSCAMCL